ncbi:motility associated factor glycosyltransferase family protein [Lysinibacillus endophyticus]|uniref:motility associated factor glycosyltransferase family protein n=1 Tax=Ureibacillus endophyticus TaxID=1978490 RepID=UPI0020A0028B|nr:6-hydroxymethylpterin diphosphokinase MptE-like protein [Lysinibacillus endophyticus]MCP1143741.1 DUF115 domain-containing protein [Lysinibacillus endophyticus]
MLIDNRIILKKKNSNTYNKLIELENTSSNIQIIPSKNGEDTLVLKLDNQNYSLHSKYNPRREAQTFIEKYNDVSKNEHILFIGTGLGYHIEMILEKNPHLSFSIFEPNLEILEAFLSRINLKKYKEEKIKGIFTNINDINNFKEFVETIVRNSAIIELPITGRLYREEIDNLHFKIKDALKKKKTNIGTDVVYQKRWILNSVMNFSEVLKTPDLFKDIKSNLLQNKPVILVAAGPSLSYEIENLKKIKNEGRAYIFAVGSAVNALIEAEILPDAFFSYDPNAINAKVAERIKREQLSIPLIFGSSIGFEVLEDYPGKMIHFVTSQDTFSQHILDIDTTDIVPDARTIAVITLFILLKLKIKTIILVGQNLGFVNNKRYANEIIYDFINNELSETEKKGILLVDSVDGSKIETNEGFLNMKEDMEHILKLCNSHSEVINTTKNGAKITGTTFMTLDDVIEKKLQQGNIVTDEWLQGAPNYNVNKIMNNIKEFEKSYEEMIDLFREASKIQKEIIDDYNRGIFSKLDSQLKHFDRAFNKLKRMTYFKIIVVPATRVQYAKFMSRAHEVKAARLPRQKVEKFGDVFLRYMTAILEINNFMHPALIKLKDDNIFEEKEK